MFHRLALLWLALPTLVVSMPAQHRPGTALHSEVTVHGVRLSLTVPRRTYPRNALIRVKITLSNLAPGRELAPPQCMQTEASVDAEVLKGDGTATYPSEISLPKLPATPLCHFGGPPPVNDVPRTLTLFTYVVARNPHLRAIARLAIQGSNGPSVPPAIIRAFTPPLTVRLTTPHAPRLLLRRTPNLHIDVKPVLPVRKADLYYTDWFRCPAGDGPEIGGQGFGYYPSSSLGPFLSGPLELFWTKHGGTQVWPECAHPLEWHVAVGQRNSSVATLDYVAHSIWRFCDLQGVLMLEYIGTTLQRVP